MEGGHLDIYGMLILAWIHKTRMVRALGCRRLGGDGATGMAGADSDKRDPVPQGQGPDTQPEWSVPQQGIDWETQRGGVSTALGLIIVSVLAVVLVLAAAFLTPLIDAPPSLAGPITAGSTSTATATAVPTATATPVPLPPDRIPYLCDPAPTPATQPCTPCPYDYRPQPAPLDAVKQALDSAADTYQLPRPLVYAIAAAESSWRHDNQVSCNFDIGIMQLKKGYWRSVDLITAPACGLDITLHDPYELNGGALLGAKQLKWLYCYFAFMNSFGTSDNPAANTSAWYYAQAGKSFPDPQLCGAHANDPLYQELGAAASAGWSCPFDARPGSPTILDLVIAAYNSGVGAIAQAGGITNQWYVDGTEHWIVYFQNHIYP